MLELEAFPASGKHAHVCAAGTPTGPRSRKQDLGMLLNAYAASAFPRPLLFRMIFGPKVAHVYS